jgi:hypothetical protein
MIDSLQPTDKELFCLELDDYAVPSFISADKSYFGTLEDIGSLIDALEADDRRRESHARLIQAFKEYVAGNTEVMFNVAYRDVKLLKQVSLIAQENSVVSLNSYEHFNVWDCIYYMRCDKADSSHIWVRFDDRYARCIRTEFYNLQYAVTDEEKDYEPVDGCMGFPKQTVFEDDRVWNRLYVVEKYFDSEEELRADIDSFKTSPDPVFTEVFNDIFGDG